MTDPRQNPRCSRCRYWSNRDRDDSWLVGKCSRLVLTDDTKKSNKIAYADVDAHHRAFFRCRRDFGCVEFELSEEPTSD